MLNFNPTGENWEPGERQTLERLKLAIKYKQKQVKLCSSEESTPMSVVFPVCGPSECTTTFG